MLETQTIIHESLQTDKSQHKDGFPQIGKSSQSDRSPQRGESHQIDKAPLTGESWNKETTETEHSPLIPGKKQF